MTVDLQLYVIDEDPIGYRYLVGDHDGGLCVITGEAACDLRVELRDAVAVYLDTAKVLYPPDGSRLVYESREVALESVLVGGWDKVVRCVFDQRSRVWYVRRDLT